ncbi:MAG: DNA integrity scanning diadenylate cyclase DisA [Actinomycetota bacterium]
MAKPRSADLLRTLAAAAPGRPLRHGLDRVLQADMGALIVIGDGPEVLNICSGGFLLDAAYSPQRLSELAKMDGAIILVSDASRIARANVHLVPDPTVATAETGTRHRTAERVARSLNVPVLAVSEDQRVITVYLGDEQHTIPATSQLRDRASQALQTLQRYRDRLDRDAAELSTLEIEDVVTLRDVVDVIQLTETMSRIVSELEGDIIELGVDGRLVDLQVGELMSGVDQTKRMVIADYVLAEDADETEPPMRVLGRLGDADLMDDNVVARALGLPSGSDLDQPVSPRGYRLLSQVPRLPWPVVEAIVHTFGDLQKILAATHAELVEIGGLADERATLLEDGLRRLGEASVLRQEL